MGVTDRLTGAWKALTRADPSFNLTGYSQYLNQYQNWFTFNGTAYPLGLNQTMPGTRTEDIGGDFQSLVAQAYKSNGVVFACMLARMSIFSEARFQFRSLKNGRPGDLFGTADLGILEHPWPGATTGDLLTSMITDADLAGNAFLTRQGDRIKRMRPDWVTIVLGSFNDPNVTAVDLEAEVLGYVYYPGGRHSGYDPVKLLRSEVAHFKPIPDPTATYRGMSWLTPIIREIQGDSAASSHKLRFFENGATPNLVITRKDAPGKEAFSEWKEMMDAGHSGVANAYKTLYMTAGAEATVVGADFQQIDFKVTQGAGETRIAAASGMHPALVGLSEGMQGSSLNAGNLSQVRRNTADKTFRPLWRNAAGSLEVIVPPPSGGAQLWIDDRDIAFLREDQKDAAEIAQIKAATIGGFIKDGYKADDAVKAVEADDFGLLIGKHTGLFSVQLQAPGSTKMPAGEVPGESPVGGGTGPELLPAGQPKPKQLTSGNGASGRSMVDAFFETLDSHLAAQRVEPPSVTFAEGAIQNHITVEPAQVNTPITVERTEVHIDEGAVRVDAPITVEPAQLTIEAGAIPVNVERSDVHIAEGAVRVDAPITVEPTSVTVEAPPPAEVTVNVETPEAPVVRFEDGSIRVDVQAPSPAEVTVNLPPPPAPPEPRKVRKTVKRDEDGRITEISGGKVTKTVKRNDKGQITEIIEDEE